MLFGGNLSHPFEPERLAISERTGRLYHQIVPTQKKIPRMSNLGYGLIRSSVAVSLSEKIIPGEGEDGVLAFQTLNGVVPVKWLPNEEEPGVWAMPGDGST